LWGGQWEEAGSQSTPRRCGAARPHDPAGNAAPAASNTCVVVRLCRVLSVEVERMDGGARLPESSLKR
jgi:hypothetical protein